MLKYDIEKMRSKLNNLILSGTSYEEIYKASVELDQLIIQFYRDQHQYMAI